MPLNKNYISVPSSSQGALVEYKNKKFLKPILNVEDNLLAPMEYDNYILNEIEDIQFILSRFSDSNFVKLWLFNELEHDKIIINAKINERANEVLNKIKNFVGDTFVEKVIRPNIRYRYFNKIEKDNLSSKPIFEFSESKTNLDTRLLVNNKLNKLFAGCYIITFNNKFYYYVGSTTNLKNRINTHNLNIKEYIKALGIKDYKAIRENSLNDMLKFYLNSIILEPVSSNSKIENSLDIQKLSTLGLQIKILYLSTNYLNLFKSIYSDYKLDKGEYLLLSKITDFLVKLLESSLIRKFQPKLNIENKVFFKHLEWNDEFLDISKRYNKVPESLKTAFIKKYKIYISITVEKTINLDNLRNSPLSNKVPQYFLNDYGDFPSLTYDERLEYLIYVSTLQDICSNYNLRYYEVLINLNRFHHYKGTILKNPLKIVEVP